MKYTSCCFSRSSLSTCPSVWPTEGSLLSLSLSVSRSDPFRSFVDYCLLKIPQDRPSSGELLKVSTLPLFNPPTVTSLPVSVSPCGWVTLSHPRLPDYNTGTLKHTTTCTRVHTHTHTDPCRHTHTCTQRELLNLTRNCAPHCEWVFVSFFLSVAQHFLLPVSHLYKLCVYYTIIPTHTGEYTQIQLAQLPLYTNWNKTKHPPLPNFWMKKYV